MSALERVLERLDDVKRNGSSWVARCPGHDDRTPSLSVSVGDDGRVLIRCHAGCTIDHVLAKAGLAFADLFDSNGARSGSHEVATYDYTSATGTLLYQAVRFEPKDFRQRRPDGNGGWVWNTKGVPVVLYRLPRVLEAIRAADATVYVVEGEKDVHAVERAGGVATTNAMGAGKWRREYAEQLRGAKRVVIVADRDEPGVKHARQVADSLAGVVPEVVIMQAKTGKDATDHLAARHTLDELEPLQERMQDRAGGERLRVVTFAEFTSVTEASATPLLGTRETNVLPAGGTLLMYGDGGAGKTSKTIDAVAHLASGTPWHGIPALRPVRVLLIENEGPRGPFREKLDRKGATWEGAPFQHNVLVLEEPWARVDFADGGLRAELAAIVTEAEIDLLAAGPVSRLGMEGGGTLNEIAKFEALLESVREGVPHPLAFWLLHHENRAGDVSGAWERAPDTLVHVRLDGKQRSIWRWQKARWAPALHGRRWTLAWRDHETYEVVDRDDDEPPEKVTEETYEQRLLDHLADHPWAETDELDKAAGRVSEGRKARQRLQQAGRVTAAPSAELGLPGRATRWNLCADAASSPVPLFGTPQDGERADPSQEAQPRPPVPYVSRDGVGPDGVHDDELADLVTAPAASNDNGLDDWVADLETSVTAEELERLERLEAEMFGGHL